jgi:hypothetical protein
VSDIARFTPDVEIPRDRHRYRIAQKQQDSPQSPILCSDTVIPKEMMNIDHQENDDQVHKEVVPGGGVVEVADVRLPELVRVDGDLGQVEPRPGQPQSIERT